MTTRLSILSRTLALLVLGILSSLPSASAGGDIIYDEMLRKGGVGIIRGDTYVVTDSKTNIVTYRAVPKKATREWEGKNYLEPEVVLTDGVHVSKSLDGLDTSNLIIILFSPKEIRFIDLKRNSSGSYPRSFGNALTDEDIEKAP